MLIGDVLTKFFHGSPVSGLTVLRPFSADGQKKPVVYLTSSEVVASFYISKRDCLWYTYGFTKDGIPEYTETYSGQLKEFYGGLGGTIYICESDASVSGLKSIPTAVTLEKPITVSGRILVEDCLKKLCEYESEGRLILHRFDDLTEEQRECNNRMVLKSIREEKLIEAGTPLSLFVKKKFPEIWKTALQKA